MNVSTDPHSRCLKTYRLAPETTNPHSRCLKTDRLAPETPTHSEAKQWLMPSPVQMPQTPESYYAVLPIASPAAPAETSSLQLLRSFMEPGLPKAPPPAAREHSGILTPPAAPAGPCPDAPTSQGSNYGVLPMPSPAATEHSGMFTPPAAPARPCPHALARPPPTALAKSFLPPPPATPPPAATEHSEIPPPPAATVLPPLHPEDTNEFISQAVKQYPVVLARYF